MYPGGGGCGGPYPYLIRNFGNYNFREKRNLKSILVEIYVEIMNFDTNVTILASKLFCPKFASRGPKIFLYDIFLQPIRLRGVSIRRRRGSVGLALRWCREGRSLVLLRHGTLTLRKLALWGLLSLRGV